jgi:betaine-aldehyde dehydrogenase
MFVNMFTESGNAGASFLIESTDVDMVSFTGSIEIGGLIAAARAKTAETDGPRPRRQDSHDHV